METFPVIERNFQQLVDIKSKRNLTVVVNRINEQIKAHEFECEIGYEMGAPSECFRDMDRHLKANLQCIISEEGFINADILLAVLQRRISYKYIYFSSLHYLFSLRTLTVQS